MVIVLPAGAQIPAKPPINPAELCRNLKNSTLASDSLREAVVSYVNRLDVSSACSTLLYTLNIESVLPPHLQQRPTPREIGLVKFSLDLGVLSDQKYHSFIDPGTLPRGFMHEAQYHSETHQIPVLDFKEQTTSCERIYSDVLEFLDLTYVVFTHANLVHYTQEALDWIGQCSGSKSRRKVVVLPLETLASEMILLATGQTGHSIRVADELRPQILEHVTHVGCHYHASRDIPVCALSTSHRQAVATHGLLQKYFWDHLTKLDMSCDPTPQQIRDKSILHSITESNCSHSNHRTSHNHSRGTDSRENMDQSENRGRSESQLARDRLSENRSRLRRTSLESVNSQSSIFTLPDIFHGKKEDTTAAQTQSERSCGFLSDHRSYNQCGNTDSYLQPLELSSEGSKGVPHQINSKSLADKNQNKRFMKVEETDRRAYLTAANSSSRTSNSTSPLSQNSVNQNQESLNDPNLNQQPVTRAPKRVGIGRGFLKTASKIPPRRPNS